MRFATASWWIVPSVAAAFLTGNGGSSTRTVAPPETIAIVAGPVFSVAQEGGRIAWRGCRVIGVRNVGAGKPLRIPSRGASAVPCEAAARSTGREAIIPRDGIALSRALVAWTLFAQGNKEYAQTFTAQLPSGPVYGGAERSLGGSRGFVLSDLVGDGNLILQGRVERATDRACEETAADPFECPLNTVGGGVRRLDARSDRPVPSLPPTTLLAVSGNRVALAPAARSTPPSRPRLSEPAIEIWNPTTGKRSFRAELDGDPISIAVSTQVVAVLVGGSRRTIRVLDANSGAVLRDVPVARSALPRLTVSGTTIVYGDGRSIQRLNGRSGRQSLVVRTRTVPTSLSIEGRRLAWIEAGARTSRVVTALLPP